MNFVLGPDETLTGGHRGHGARLRAGDSAATGAPGRARLAVPLEWQDAVIRAAITLKLCAVRGHRRDRRRHDHQHPRGAEQRAQLGLPLLLAARRLLRGARAQQPLRSRHDGGVPALAQQRRGAAPAAATSSRCTASAWSRQLPEQSWCRPAGLPRHGSGARGQPGAGALPARRLRQHRPGRVAGLPRPPPVPPRRPCRVRATWKPSASRPCASTTSPTPACGSCARARASTPRRR